MSHGVRYLTHRPDPAGLAEAGISFVARTGQPGHAGTTLTLAEAQDLRVAGLWIVSCVDAPPIDTLKGHAAGRLWAREAGAWFLDCGMPDNLPIYFGAIAPDVPQRWTHLRESFRGMADEIGSHRIGIHGSHQLITWAMSEQLAVRYWQHGPAPFTADHWGPGLHLRTTRCATTWREALVDLVEGVRDGYGAWMPPPAPGWGETGGMTLRQIRGTGPAIPPAPPSATGGGEGDEPSQLDRIEGMLDELIARTHGTFTQPQLEQLASVVRNVVGVELEDALGRLGFTVRPRG